MFKSGKKMETLVCKKLIGISKLDPDSNQNFQKPDPPIRIRNPKKVGPDPQHMIYRVNVCKQGVEIKGIC